MTVFPLIVAPHRFSADRVQFRRPDPGMVAPAVEWSKVHKLTKTDKSEPFPVLFSQITTPWHEYHLFSASLQLHKSPT
jgi:hypothetical protein